MRHRFWSYEFARGFKFGPSPEHPNGKIHWGGLRSGRPSMYTLMGTHFHEGVEDLLRGREIEGVVAERMSAYWREANKRGLAAVVAGEGSGTGTEMVEVKTFAGPSGFRGIAPDAGQAQTQLPPGFEDLPASPFSRPADVQESEAQAFARARNNWTMREQVCLLEAMIRAWDLRIKPFFLEAYDVLEIEKDYPTKLDVVNLPGRPDPLPHVERVLQSKADILLWDKFFQRILLGNFKTSSGDKPYPKAIKGYQIDNQGVAEIIGWETHHPGQQIAGVMMMIAMKGKRDMDKSLGWKVTDSPLLGGWKKDVDGVVGKITNYAWSWFNLSPKDPAKSKTGMGALGPSWTKFNVWDYPGGVKGWVEDLHYGRVQPELMQAWGNPLDNLFHFTEPIARATDEIHRWWRQASIGEGEMVGKWELAGTLSQMIMQGASGVDDETAKLVEATLDEQFPQNRKKCNDWYGDDCPMWGLCHTGSKAMGAMGFVQDGKLEWAEPHHDKLVQIEG